MAKIPDDDDGGILMPILVSLLVVVGLVTAGLFGYIGYHTKMNQAAIIPGSSQEQPQTSAQSQQKAQVYMPNATENTSQEQKELSEDTPTAPEEQSNTVGEESTPQKTDENASTPTEKPQTPSSGTQSRGGTKSSGGESWGKDSTTNEITGDMSRPAYWTKNGKSYHFSKDCVSLKKSTILSGTLQDAINAGKKDPCNHCAGGS